MSEYKKSEDGQLFVTVVLVMAKWMAAAMKMSRVPGCPSAVIYVCAHI